MHALLLFLLIPILIILVFLLGLGLFAYAKLASFWYKLTGKQPKNPFGAWTTGSEFGTGNDFQQNNQHTNTQQRSSNARNSNKIFSDKDGEYVDFEVVD